MVHCHLGPTRSGRAGIVRSVSCDQGFVTAHSLHSSCHARPFAHQRLHERQRIVARRRPTGRYEAMNLSLMCCVDWLHSNGTSSDWSSSTSSSNWSLTFAGACAAYLSTQRPFNRSACYLAYRYIRCISVEHRVNFLDQDPTGRVAGSIFQTRTRSKFVPDRPGPVFHFKKSDPRSDPDPIKSII